MLVEPLVLGEGLAAVDGEESVEAGVADPVGAGVGGADDAGSLALPLALLRRRHGREERAGAEPVRGGGAVVFGGGGPRLAEARRRRDGGEEERAQQER